jgi:hypothetical protein
VRISNITNVLAGLALATGGAAAQNGAVPGRDLLTYPVGLVAEAGALPGMLGIGLFNPASAVLPVGSRWRIAAAAMSTPSEIAATAQAGGVSANWRNITFTGSVLRAAVAGIVRTDSDPLTTGNDVTYTTQVMSLGAALPRGKHLTFGAAMRVRTGQIDFERRTAVALDAGIVAAGLTPLDARIAAATYLAAPFSKSEEPATVVASADVRVAGRDSTRTSRAGFAFSDTPGRSREQFYFGSVRYLGWELRGGAVRTQAHDFTTTRARLGIGVHYGAYIVGLARESTPAGLAPSYQFVLSTVLR